MIPDLTWWYRSANGELTQLTIDQNADAGLTYRGIPALTYDLWTSQTKFNTTNCRIWTCRLYSCPPPAVWTCRVSIHHQKYARVGCLSATSSMERAGCLSNALRMDKGPCRVSVYSPPAVWTCRVSLSTSSMDGGLCTVYKVSFHHKQDRPVLCKSFNPRRVFVNAGMPEYPVSSTRMKKNADHGANLVPRNKGTQSSTGLRSRMPECRCPAMKIHYLNWGRTCVHTRTCMC